MPVRIVANPESFEDYPSWRPRDSLMILVQRCAIAVEAALKLQYERVRGQKAVLRGPNYINLVPDELPFDGRFSITLDSPAPPC